MIIINERKYELTSITTKYKGLTLKRIRSLKDFGIVKKGELGGFVETENNLSHFGSSWIFGNAKVCENATVLDDAWVGGKSQVYEYGMVCDQARVYGNSKIYGNACISGHASVFDSAKVHGSSKIYDRATIRDYAEITDSAEISGEAVVKETAFIGGNSIITDLAQIQGKAIIDEQCLCTGRVVVRSDLRSDLIESIRAQTGLLPVNGELIAYKQVNKDLSSIYNPFFVYTIGEMIEEPNAEESHESCAAGLHFSNAIYWDKFAPDDSIYLIAKIKLEDIITVQEGKIRCRKAFILGTYNNNNNNNKSWV